MSKLTSMHDHSLFPQQPWELAASASLGLSSSQLRFAICFLLSVLVGAILRYVPTPKARHVYSIVTGFLLVYYPFGNGVLHAFVPTSLAYFFMRRFRQHCGTLTWLTAFPYLILCHVLQASGAAWKEGQLDFTGAQMVLTLKVIAIAMCYQDALKKPEDLRPYPASKRLSQLPSLLEFWSYAFAAGNLLAGPFFEAHDWFDYIERKGDWDERDPAKRIPSPVLPGLTRLAKGIICAALWVQLSSRFGADMLESQWFHSSAVSVPKRMVLIWLAGFTARCKYYFAWAIAESAIIFSGLCYNGRGEDGRPRWNRFINSRIRRVEFNTSLAALAANWNICTGLWLRHYVYDRLTPPGRQPGLWQLVATQTVSGVWHGLFPGYWLFFLSSAIMFNSSKILYRYEQAWPPRLRSFPLWTMGKMLITAFVLNYAAMAFIVLWLRETLAVWSSVYFLGHVYMLVLHLLAAVMPPRRRKIKLAAEKQAAGSADTAAQAGGSGAAVADDGQTAAASVAAAAALTADEANKVEGKTD